MTKKNILTFCFVISFFLASNLHSQIGFNFYNQRNHPELKWQFIETPHIRIIYHERLENLARKAAVIAENSFSTITQNLAHTPEGKVPIYISDQDEIANGFDVSNRYIIIWANLNNYFVSSTGPDKWLRKVISHELVHYIHFSAISTWLGFIGHGFTGTPRWFIEGLAQYESETWNIHRGDLVLRTRVMSDEMDYSKLYYPSDGAMLYATGNSAVRFLADKYGDESLRRILTHRNHFLFPYYNFSSAFHKEIKKSNKEFYNEWRKQVNIYYNTVSGQKEQLEDFAQKLDLPFEYIYDFRISPDSAWFAVVGIHSYIEPVRRLYLVSNDSAKSFRQLDENNVLPGISFSPDSRHIVYSKIHRGAHGSLLPDIFITDLNGKKKQLTRNLRATSPAYSPKTSRIAFSANTNGNGNLFLLNLVDKNQKQLTHFSNNVQISYPRWSPDGKWIAFMLSDSTGRRDIAVISADGAIFKKVTNDEFDNRNPVWSGDGKLLGFTSYRTGIPNIFAVSVKNEPDGMIKFTGFRQLTDTADGLYALDWTDSAFAALVMESQTKQSVYLIDDKREVQEAAIQIKSRFSTWQHHQPPFGIPDFFPAKHDSLQISPPQKYNSFKNIGHYFTVPIPYIGVEKYGVSLISYWAEPLGKHNFLAWGDFVFNQFNESQYIFTYLNNQFYPSMQLSYFQTPFEFQFFENELLIENRSGTALNMLFPFNSGGNLFSNHAAEFQFIWTQNTPYMPEWWDEKVLQPASGKIVEFMLGYRWKYQTPDRQRMIHPANSRGLKLQARIADAKWKSELTYQRYILDAYANLPIKPLNHMLYLRMNLQAISGTLLPQHQLGFDRYDQPDFGLELPFGERERLRGIREYQFGNRLILGNIEYRFPLIKNLGWNLAGFSFHQLTGAFFLDTGSVWEHPKTPFQKISFLKTGGLEFKNSVRLSVFNFVHSFGLAWNLSQKSDESEFYYRVRSVLPF